MARPNSCLAVAVEGKNNNWDFDALVSMYDFVQLTPEIPEKTGWAFSKEVGCVGPNTDRVVSLVL